MKLPKGLTLAYIVRQLASQPYKFNQKGVCMFAVRTRRGYLATFASKAEAEQWLRDWTANHGHRAWIERTEL